MQNFIDIIDPIYRPRDTARLGKATSLSLWKLKWRSSAPVSMIGVRRERNRRWRRLAGRRPKAKGPRRCCCRCSEQEREQLCEARYRHDPKRKASRAGYDRAEAGRRPVSARFALVYVNPSAWKLEVGGYPVLKKCGSRQSDRRDGRPVTVDELVAHGFPSVAGDEHRCAPRPGTARSKAPARSGGFHLASLYWNITSCSVLGTRMRIERGSSASQAGPLGGMGGSMPSGSTRGRRRVAGLEVARARRGRGRRRAGRRARR